MGMGSRIMPLTMGYNLTVSMFTPLVSQYSACTSIGYVEQIERTMRVTFVSSLLSVCLSHIGLLCFCLVLQLCGKLRRDWSEHEVLLVDVFYVHTFELDRPAVQHRISGLPSLKLFDEFSRHIFRVLITPS